ncbi:thiamine pyrophosphate enzyme-like TPP-binding protein [Advenella kashmirensis W13003]|uniref:Thiamine pyrophosphate enzyme-like TPP-binding protein n=1 Tax=Advenella kashmirensis W13003 TaxID=1424334 RepID=V8QNS2_9BURK|nr:thiamine pyrophosphate-dependent enzyme [Advenella kashmirensis]ETF01606.1 thiamine pyrophosphate enzyme-like TPP-binding protein [Advenella kashmirensis W13003]
MTMTAEQVVSITESLRVDAVVVFTMGAMNEYDRLPANDLNVACVPLMGGAASLGLGIALACPDRKVVVLDGDASLLMELGGLVSVATAAPQNLIHIVLNNGVQFAGLGNLRTPGAASVDFEAMANAARYHSTVRCSTAETFSQELKNKWKRPGPHFIEAITEYGEATLGRKIHSLEMTDHRFSRMGEELRRIRKFMVNEI